MAALDNITMKWDNPNRAEAISLFRQQCEMLFRRKKITDPQDQIDEILLRTGEKGILKFNSWGLSDDDKKRPDIVWKKFEEYGQSNQNFRVARLALRNVNQKIDSNTNEPETMDEFISRLRLQAAQCDFRKTKHRDEFNSEFDKTLIERIIAGTIYLEVQKQLLAKDKKMILEKAIQIGKNMKPQLTT